MLAIFGSGETAPHMANVHRAVLRRLGTGPLSTAIVDTPYGFQPNADAITAAAAEYFANRLRLRVSVASYRRADADSLGREAALARIRDADYVFSGPGSPTYALRQWEDGPVPALLADKLAHGGGLAMASAAALTLGRLTLPVYEVYKVGHDPHWVGGLDLLTAVGLPVAVVPHYDNAEGGGHDTRYCFMGERRLAELEAEMPDDVFILGIDENTALVLDLDAGRATVRGRGRVTVRRHGRSVSYGHGTDMLIGELHRAALGNPPGPGPGRAPKTKRGEETGRGQITRAESAFATAIRELDLPAAMRCILILDEVASAWPAVDPLTRRDARGVMRTMVARVAQELAGRLDDQARLVAPLADMLVEQRARARSVEDWAIADAIRDGLARLGIEVADAADGTSRARLPGGPEPL
jgi:hypothetical protein